MCTGPRRGTGCKGAAKWGRGCQVGQGLPAATSHPFPFSKDMFKVPVSVNSLNTAQMKAGFSAGGVGGQWPHCRLWQLVGMRAAELNRTQERRRPLKGEGPGQALSVSAR